MTDSDHVLDSLGGQEAHRVREVSAMVPTDGNLTDEQRDEIRVKVAAYIKSVGHSLELVETKIGQRGLNKTYLSNFLSGRFDAIPARSLDRVARALNDWHEIDHARQGRKLQPQFVHTKVAERLIKVARHAAETCDIVVAHGPAGCGKSATLEELTKIIPGSILIYITPDAVRKGGFQRALYEAVWEHRGPARPTLSDVIARLKYSDRLLMLDNCDLLHPDTFPVIMSLYDVARIPILICGTHRLLAKLTHDADPLRGQMSSRIGLRAELLRETTAPSKGRRSAEWISADEIRRLYERGRIRLHPKAVLRLKVIACREIGHLRRTERYVRYATLQLPREGQVLVTPEILERAIRLVDADEAPPIREELAAEVEAAAV